MSQPRRAQEGAKLARVAREAGLYRLDGAKRTSFGSWSQIVFIDERKYAVGASQGQRVRIAYSAKWGHRWHGYVRDEKGHEVWGGQVGKSDGVFALLRYSGFVPSLRVGDAVVGWGKAMRRLLGLDDTGCLSLSRNPSRNGHG